MTGHAPSCWHRWSAVVVSIDGERQHHTHHVLRGAALVEAAKLASPFYDVFVERARTGLDRMLVFPHTAPEDLARILRARS